MGFFFGGWRVHVSLVVVCHAVAFCSRVIIVGRCLTYIFLFFFFAMEVYWCFFDYSCVALFASCGSVLFVNLGANSSLSYCRHACSSSSNNTCSTCNSSSILRSYKVPKPGPYICSHLTQLTLISNLVRDLRRSKFRLTNRASNNSTSSRCTCNNSSKHRRVRSSVGQLGTGV